jgi:hypothetical protein
MRAEVQQSLEGCHLQQCCRPDHLVLMMPELSKHTRLHVYVSLLLQAVMRTQVTIAGTLPYHHVVSGAQRVCEALMFRLSFFVC